MGSPIVALEELTSAWGRALKLQGSDLKGPWRGKGNLDELLIYEVRSQIKHHMEVCVGVSAVCKDELSTWA